MLKQSPYEILKLEGDFTFSDIKKAYRKAIRENTPKQNPEIFAKVCDAYESLTNENYFFKDMNENSYTSTTEIKAVKNEKIDNTVFLKKIFEVPFYD